jgi:hypothetical protein
MINGFIAVSGELKTAEGIPVSAYMGGDINALGSDWNRANAYTYSTLTANNSSTVPSGTEGISVCSLTRAVPLFGEGIGDTCDAVADSFRFVNTLVFGVEMYMQSFARLFPAFALIFYGVIAIALALKILFVIYIAIIIRQLLGRSQ